MYCKWWFHKSRHSHQVDQWWWDSYWWNWWYNCRSIYCRCRYCKFIEVFCGLVYFTKISWPLILDITFSTMDNLFVGKESTYTGEYLSWIGENNSRWTISWSTPSKYAIYEGSNQGSNAIISGCTIHNTIFERGPQSSWIQHSKRRMFNWKIVF